MVVQPPFSSFLKLFSAHCAASAQTAEPDPDLTCTKGPARPGESPPRRGSAMARFKSHQRKKSTRSIISEGPWKVDTPFGPPRISHIHVPGGIQRIRNTLSKLSPSARAERELLRQKNRYKIPLTERNIDTFVTHQEFSDARYPNQHSTEIQVTAWLDRLY
ncbi:hypothetical protein BJY01DRAFT_177593 [Aspergillus pseudoustus]|uniref:Uncharacterized protein n=1 Tax=Aspergillus pseudoustus TaxID=1810923 RepID=A0ABR4K0F7_9EURO